ncbi:uncharacterized protein PG986_000926, partial [Apiospora aurea]
SGESYPQPIQGVEYVGFIRRTVWQNAGFGALRRIWMHIGNAEPRFMPTVFPCDVPSHDAKVVSVTDEAKERNVPAFANCAVAQYRRSYLSGDVTPQDIVEALLPLIRCDISPPGIHSTAWVDIKIDLVLKAAEASTLRYRRQKSLGPLDGILVGIKDQYDVDGYSTMLGSSHDLTGRDQDGNAYNS